MRRIATLALTMTVILSLALAGCEPEGPVVTGSGEDAPGGSGDDTANFDFDVSNGDGGARDVADDVADAEGDDVVQGDVSCTEPEQACGNECVDITSNIDHCGACNSRCPEPENATVSCVASNCRVQCAGGGIDTDGDISNGCECVLTNGGEEICDAVDNDCDGEIDEGCDEDGDGFCAESVAVTSEATCQPGDCDDTNPDINPDAPAACDGLDNNCDGEVDNLVADPSARRTVSLRGSFSASSTYPATALAAFAGDGFCAVALDDSRESLEFAWLATAGSSSSQSGTVASDRDVDLLDLEWDGTDCVALYREGPRTLKLRSWRPGSSSTTTLEATDRLSGEGSWRSVRNAALWFGDVTRCDDGRCTSEERWVVVYVDGGAGRVDTVAYLTVPQRFTASEQLLPGVVIHGGVSGNSDVDIIGTGRRGDGFLALDRADQREMTIYEVVEEDSTLLDGLTVNDPDITRATLNKVGGQLMVQHRIEGTSDRWETGLRKITSRSYGTRGVVRSSSEDAFLGRNFAWTIDGTDHLYVDGYSDTVYRVTPTGTGARFFDFTEVAHPEFDRFTELLAPGKTGDTFWVASLIDASSYELAIDAFACF